MKQILFSLVLVLFGFFAFADVPVTSDEIPTDAALVKAEKYQMFFDSEKKIIYVFAPATQPVSFTVTPLAGWSWNRNQSGSHATAKPFTIRGSGKKKIVLYGAKPEDRFDFQVAIREIIAYVEIDPYFGVNMKKSTDDVFFKQNNTHSAKVFVLPGRGFTLAAKNPYTWTVSNVVIDDKTKHNSVVAFCLPKSGSRSENCEKASVKVSGMFNNRKCTLEGFANFTIVCVDVCVAGVTEGNEDGLGYQCEKGSAVSRSKVKFTCTPTVMSYRANDLVVTGANLLEQYSEHSRAKYRPAGDFTVDRLKKQNTFYLDTSKCVGGNVDILHPASCAIDTAKYACWGVEFKTPSGDPVREPVPDKNEFCYTEEDVGRCTINLVVGVVPDGVKGLSLERIREQYKNARFSIDKKLEPDVKLEWDEALGGNKGQWSSVNGNIECRARATYIGMPANNRFFGGRNAEFKNETKTLTAMFEVFYPKFAKNHPVCQNCPRCSNWFYYWRQGAVPGLGADYVKFADLGDGDYGTSPWKAEDGKMISKEILVSDLASMVPPGEYDIYKYSKDGLKPDKDSLFRGKPGHLVGDVIKIGVHPDYKGVAFAAAVVRHENLHLEIAEDYLKHGGSVKDIDGDRVSNEYEVSDADNRFGFTTYEDMAASYNLLDQAPHLAQKYGSPSGDGGGVDNEIRARYDERKVMTEKPYDVKQDWAKPGCQSCDIYGPPE